MMKARNLRRVFKKSVAVLLALTLAFAAPLRTLASEDGSEVMLAGVLPSGAQTFVSNGDGTDGQTYYVCDVKTATEDSYAKAYSKLSNAGYYVVSQNTNEGSEEDSCCLIGYKLTTDRSQAITSLRIMEMAGGYEFKDYKKFLNERTPGLATIVSQFMNACRRLKKLVDQKNPNAVYAYNTLNLLCVPDSAEERTGTPLGEYITSSARTKDDIETLILVSTSDVISFMNGLLAAGCAETYVNTSTEKMDGRVADPDFVERTAYLALEKYSALSPEELEAVKKERKKEAALFRTNLKALGEVEVRYLDEVLIHFDFSRDEDDPEITSAKDLVFCDDAALTACFIDALPEGVPADDFVSIFTEYVADERIPAKLEPLPAVVSPWMRDTIQTINEETENPYNGEQAIAIIEHYQGAMSDIELLASEVDYFIAQYRRQKPVFDALLEEMPDASMDEVLKEFTNRLEAGKYESEDEEAAMSDLIYFMGAYMVLSKYRISPKANLTMANGKPCGNLGEYFELIADAENADTKNALVCAILSRLSEAHLYNMKTAGLPSMILSGGTSPEDQTIFTSQYEDNKNRIQTAYAEAGYAANECTVWFGTNRDLIDTEKLAYTDEAKRLEAGGKDLLDSYNATAATMSKMSDISEALKISGLAMSAVGVLWAGGTFALAIMGQMAATSITGLFQLGIACLTGASTATALGAGVMAAAICGFAGMMLSAVLLVAFIVILVLMFTTKIEDEDIATYTDIPTVLLDCEEDLANELIMAVRYDVVRDLSTSKPSDLNDMDETGASRWIALYYSRDLSAGSPIIAYNGSYFKTGVDDMTLPEKSVALSKFGYTTPYNVNSYNKSSKNTVYFYYYSEHSVAGVVDRHTPGKYLCDMRMAIAYTENMAKGSLLSMKDYSVYDRNLTPESDFYTYIGYTTTNDPARAITDIRVKYASTDYKLKWGSGNGDLGNEYISLFDEQHTTCPLKTVIPQDGNEKMIYVTPFGYQLYYSKSSVVGDPILADSLQLFSSLSAISGIYKNYEYVRWFSGGAFDFITDTDNSTNCKEDTHRFLGYTTEEAGRGSGQLYLAGLAFFTGSNYLYVSAAGELNDETEGWTTLEAYANGLGYTLLKQDIAGDAYDAIPPDGEGSKFGDERNNPLYLAYAVTKDPKKAITDIGLFTGEPKGEGNLLGNITRNSVSFEAAQIFRQEFHGTMFPYISRNLFISNAYITKNSEEAEVFNNKKWKDIAEEMSKTTGRKTELTVKPRGLYFAGPCEGVAPISLSDVLYSSSYGAVPSTRGMQRGLYSLATGESVIRVSGGGWKTVHALDDYFYDEYDADENLMYPGTNLGVSRDEFSGLDGILYLYYRNASTDAKTGKTVFEEVPIREKYVASAEIVGSLQENGAYDIARYSAMLCGAEIVNADTPLYAERGNKYDIRDDSIIYNKNDSSVTAYRDKCYYISVRYQDSSVGAVASLIMDYQDGKTALPDTISAVYRKTSRVSSKELSATYKRGASYAPTKPDKKDKDGKVIPTACSEGYVLYSASHTGAAARILVLNNVLDVKAKTDPSVSGMGRRFAENADGTIYSTDGNMKQTIALYSYSEPYVYDITVVKGGTPTEAELKLGQMGFSQIIYTDVLAATSNEPVYIGIMRTKVPAEALQDIKIVYEKQKETIPENGLNYRRVNDIDLAYSSTMSGSGLSPVYIYVSTGSSRSARLWGERTAITNLGISYVSGNGKTQYVFWNGIPSEDGIPSKKSPANFTKTTRILDVASVEYKHQLEEQDIDDYLGYLNKDLYDKTLTGIGATGGNAAAMDFKQRCGYTWLVYTTNSNICYNDYAQYLSQGRVTGTAAGDAARGIGSVISEHPRSPLILSAAAGVIVAVTMLVFIVKRKRYDKK